MAAEVLAVGSGRSGERRWRSREWSDGHRSSRWRTPWSLKVRSGGPQARGRDVTQFSRARPTGTGGRIGVREDYTGPKGPAANRLYQPSDVEFLFAGQDLAQDPGRRPSLLGHEIPGDLQGIRRLLSNPRMAVRDIIAEGIDIHAIARSKEERTSRSRYSEPVQLDPRLGHHRPSIVKRPAAAGGDRPRRSPAPALVIYADEPVSALDVLDADPGRNLLKTSKRLEDLPTFSSPTASRSSATSPTGWG